MANTSFLTLDPIGVVRTAASTKVEAPRQPRASEGAVGTIELFPQRNFEHALEDLAGWERLWVVFWFHLNPGWRPKVRPPRSSSGRKGVFATRSPHRPNPLGLSVVRLERVDGLTLHILDVDMVDGTPVLDIKPYVPYTDAWPTARSGWLDDLPGRADATDRGTTPADPIAPWVVTFDSVAAKQAAWVEARTGLPLKDRITAALALGPTPSAYRRITRDGGALRLKVKEWRVRFSARDRVVRVDEIASGYRSAQIAASGRTAADPLAPHREFLAAWGGSPPGRDNP